jgi:hypothetical protein
MTATHGFNPGQTEELLNYAGAGTGGAGSTSMGQAQSEAARTRNTSGFTGALDQASRNRTRAMGDINAGIGAQDVLGAKQLNQQGAAGEAGLYGTDTSAMLGAMGQVPADIAAQMAAQQHGWMQDLSGGIAIGQQGFNLASDIAGSFCPAEGSLYEMADGSKRPVEALIVGDRIAGIDGDPQTVEEIQSNYAGIVAVTTADGHVTRNSPTHAFALPRGGFTVAAKSLGKAILTEFGTSIVTGVEYAGKAWVFNVITDGSHTYCADGVWALGVGEAERHVGMNEWAKIGDRLRREAKLLGA